MKPQDELQIVVGARVSFKTCYREHTGIVEHVQGLTGRARVKTDEGEYFLVALEELRVVA